MTPVALALAALLQSASPATSPPATTATAPAPALPDGEKVVCRRVGDIGSRVGGTRECLTKNQWAERERGNAQNLRDMQVKSYQTRPQ